MSLALRLSARKEEIGEKSSSLCWVYFAQISLGKGVMLFSSTVVDKIRLDFVAVDMPV